MAYVFVLTGTFLFHFSKHMSNGYIWYHKEGLSWEWGRIKDDLDFNYSLVQELLNSELCGSGHKDDVMSDILKHLQYHKGKSDKDIDHPNDFILQNCEKLDGNGKILFWVGAYRVPVNTLLISFSLT